MGKLRPIEKKEIPISNYYAVGDHLKDGLVPDDKHFSVDGFILQDIKGCWVRTPFYQGLNDFLDKDCKSQDLF